MPYLLNLIYLAAWAALAPWLCWQAWFRNKPTRGVIAKWFGRVEIADRNHHAERDVYGVVWFHGVSLGEIHLLRQVVAQFRKRFPDWQCVVSTTTNTGYDEARKCFTDLPVVYWPFDFTWAVQRALDTIKPTLVVLSEGEIWPNFVHVAKQRGVKIAVINGRMSPRSANRFRLFRWLLFGVFAKLDLIIAQNDEYREQYKALGAVNVIAAGNIKYDGVQFYSRLPSAEEELGVRDCNLQTLVLREQLGIQTNELVWVAGSTQAPEEALALDVFRCARVIHPKLRLILVPRHPERFDEVARLLYDSGLLFVRKSARVPIPPDAIILADTMGELSAIWGLADVAFVGGSLDGKRGGQNMIEPSAYGAAVLFGPHTWNFKQTVADLLAHDAAIQVENAADFQVAVLRLLGDAALRDRLGQAARNFVLSQQGATAKTLDALHALLGITSERKIAA